jgi:hypothetical protein
VYTFRAVSGPELHVVDEEDLLGGGSLCLDPGGGAPELSDDEYAAWVDELIAGDPEARPVPTASQVIAAGEVDPVSGPLIASLAAVELGGLGDAELVGAAVAWTRIRNYADAQVAHAIVTQHDRFNTREAFDAATLTAAEFGVALHLGDGAADRLTRAAVDLTRRFAATLTAVSAGDVTWAKAVELSERTVTLTPEQAAAVEDRVLPHAATRTPRQHTDAVRRAVDRIDPDGADERRRQARKDIDLIRTHVGDGMGELFARLPSEDLDTIWTGADTWARRAKAAGQPGTLGQLRINALLRWAESFLTHGNPTTCDTTCQPLPPDDGGGSADDDDPPDPRGAGAPRRHGRPVTLRVIWDLDSLLGLASRCGELADTGATLTPTTINRLLTRGGQLRRLLIDPAAGELLDLTPAGYSLPPTDGAPHGAPVELHVVIPLDRWHAWRDRTDPTLAAAVDNAHPCVRNLLDAARTADDLDNTPEAYPVPARLADFIATRDRHPTNPCAGPSPAHAADIDHTLSVRAGGTTVRINLTPLIRRWHRTKTRLGWTVQHLTNGWLWTSPTGRTITTRPHDYRLGP